MAKLQLSALCQVWVVTNRVEDSPSISSSRMRNVSVLIHSCLFLRAVTPKRYRELVNGNSSISSPARVSVSTSSPFRISMVTLQSCLVIDRNSFSVSMHGFNGMLSSMYGIFPWLELSVFCVGFGVCSVCSVCCVESIA